MQPHWHPASRSLASSASLSFGPSGRLLSKVMVWNITCVAASQATFQGSIKV